MHWGVASWVRGSQGASGSGVTSLETVFKTAESFCCFVLCSSWASTLRLNYSGFHVIRRHTHRSPIYQQLFLLTRLQLRPVSSSLSQKPKSRNEVLPDILASRAHLEAWRVRLGECAPDARGKGVLETSNGHDFQFLKNLKIMRKMTEYSYMFLIVALYVNSDGAKVRSVTFLSSFNFRGSIAGGWLEVSLLFCYIPLGFSQVQNQIVVSNQ